jgi:RimJ/RimL family protein N-acetyltransferase
MTHTESIETDRLVMRPHRIQDFEDSYSMWSDSAVTRFISGKPSSREDAWARLLRYAGTWSLLGYGFWVVREKASGRFVGEAGFLNAQRDIVPPFGDRPEVGWALMPWAHGQGYATEAVRAALGWGEARWGWRETVCMIAPGNIPSLRVAEKVGFVETGRSEYKGEAAMLFARRKPSGCST